MEMFMKENGHRIRLTEEAVTYIETEPPMKEIGLRINSMDLGLNGGRMMLGTRENTTWELSTVEELLYGGTDPLTKENSIGTIYTEGESINGLMVANIMENGRKIRWTGKEYSPGKMEGIFY
jgi:hypothetical protein